MNMNTYKILDALSEMDMKLSNYIVSDSECMNLDDDNAEFDVAMLNDVLQKLEAQIGKAIKEVIDITGYSYEWILTLDLI